VNSSYPAAIAVAVGVLVTVVALAPWVAVQYRRRGSIGIGNAVIAVGTVVYALAIMTYTLLPLPSDPVALCRQGAVSAQLHPFAFIGDIERAGGLTGPAALLRNPAAAQVFFNVVLFVPLGMIVRYSFLRGRFVPGVVVGTLVGAAVSLLVECTQITGDWFIYPCAYRLFDVDDLIANTAGALVGTLLAPLLRLVPGQISGTPALARPVTATRRALGMVCDVLAVTLAGVALGVGVELGVRGAGGDPDSQAAISAATVVAYLPAAVQLAWVVVSGRTLGEAAVRLRPTHRPALGRAFLRWALGVGGWSILMVTALPLTGIVAFLLTASAVIGVWATRNHRGFAYATAGLQVEDDRAERYPTDASSGTAAP